jgi:hypothetical protein
VIWEDFVMTVDLRFLAGLIIAIYEVATFLPDKIIVIMRSTK